MKCFKYSNRPKAYITVKLLEEPYGESSEKVVSLGCTLKGDMQNPTWKVHVPLDLAESVGQELIRIARLDREKSTKNSDRQTIQAKKTTTAENTKPAHVQPSEDETRALTIAAVSQGRVIKRPRKQERDAKEEV